MNWTNQLDLGQSFRCPFLSVFRSRKQAKRTPLKVATLNEEHVCPLNGSHRPNPPSTSALHLRRQDKPKMHELYAVWLSCKGVWGECSLKLKAIKATSNEATELYDFLTAAGVEAELGEDLAKDLIQRHVEAEAKLPLNKKGQFIKVYLGSSFIANSIHEKLVY